MRTWWRIRSRWLSGRAERARGRALDWSLRATELARRAEDYWRRSRGEGG